MASSYKRKHKTVFLENIPETGQMPLKHLGIVEQLMKDPDTDAPPATVTVRNLLEIIASNASLFIKARQLKVCDDLSVDGIIRYSVGKIVMFHLSQKEAINGKGKKPK